MRPHTTTVKQKHLRRPNWTPGRPVCLPCGAWLEGNVRLQPGTRVEIEGVAEAVTGTYVLTAVTHTVERNRGFISEISSELPMPPDRSKAASATLGIVTAVNDPDNLGRVQVSLPAYGNVETDWMGVLAT